MMRSHVTLARIRAILAGVMTETDAAIELRAHRVKYSFSTAGGVLHIRIPSRTGIITVTRTASRSNPFRIQTEKDAYPFPVPVYSWDD